MDYTAGFVAMHVHAADVRRAEERIALQRAAAERAAGAGPDATGLAPARGAWLRAARGRHAGRHAALLAR
ncbi:MULTISPECIES: hypothetical protein [unclassified Agromyces]|uniref:hypothetical protein n=1 Tax=unclassified Agromyces TaxID=2639701 RepID=UPI00301530A5